MLIEDESYFALLARIEKLEAAARDPEADRYLNGLAWGARVDVADLVSGSVPLLGACVDPATGEALPTGDRPTPGMALARLHSNRPFAPRAWRRITDAERIALCLKPHEDAAAIVQFVITDYVKHEKGHRGPVDQAPVYQEVTEFWLDPSPPIVAMLHAFGDGLPCHFTRHQMLAAGMRMAGDAQVPGTGPDSCEAGAPASPPPIAGPAGAAEEPERESAAAREDCDAWE